MDLPEQTIKTKEILAAEHFASLAASVRRKAAGGVKKQKKLIANLKGDLEKHGEPGRWKKYGDLLLANASTAQRRGDYIAVTDYFDDNAPTIEIKGDQNRSLTEIAEEYFRLYTKARNGVRVIDERMSLAVKNLTTSEKLLEKIDKAIAESDIEFLESIAVPQKKTAAVGKKKKAEAAFKGARRFRSSDGFDILVGKKAKDNDFLTFRIARSLETWLHAADYPGSHVIIRNANRKEIPNSTLVEAAQLAAFYSDARSQPKAAVHYTLKKFVNKPKRAAPGLVSMASFKTILIEPKIGSVSKVD